MGMPLVVQVEREQINIDKSHPNNVADSQKLSRLVWGGGLWVPTSLHAAPVIAPSPCRAFVVSVGGLLGFPCSRTVTNLPFCGRPTRRMMYSIREVLILWGFHYNSIGWCKVECLLCNPGIISNSIIFAATNKCLQVMSYILKNVNQMLYII